MVHAPEIIWTGNGLGSVSEGVRTEVDERLRRLLGNLFREVGLGEPFGFGRYPILLAEAATARGEEETATIAGGFSTPDTEEIEWWEGESNWRSLTEEQCRTVLRNIRLSPALRDSFSNWVLEQYASIQGVYIDHIGIITLENLRSVLLTFWPYYDRIGTFQQFMHSVQTTNPAQIIRIPKFVTQLQEPDIMTLRFLQEDISAESMQYEHELARLRRSAGIYEFWRSQRLLGEGEIALLIPITAQSPLVEEAASAAIPQQEQVEAEVQEAEEGAPIEARMPGRQGAGRVRVEEEQPPAPTGPPPCIDPARYDPPQCRPFLCEPHLERLGSDGDTLRRIMQEIADQFEMSYPCGYAAQFCMDTAEELRALSEQVEQDLDEEQAGSLRAAEADAGNLGAVDFEPSVSPAIEFLRRLARITPMITRLALQIERVYPSYAHLIGGAWYNDYYGWGFRFWLELDARMKRSVALIFGRACQVLLLQLLRASRQEISSRLENIEIYASIFRTFIVPRLKDIQTLMELRDRLRNYQYMAGAHRALSSRPGTIATVAAGPYAGFVMATRSLLESLTAAQQAPGGEGTIQSGIVVEGNTARIRDAEGRIWSMEGLERAILIRRGVIEAIDPLVKQLVELEEILQRFRSPAVGVRNELKRLLREMLENNGEKERETRRDWKYAFQASRIQENIPARTVLYTSFALRGIHLQAHEQIGESFEGDRYYAHGINALFGAELGIEGLTNFVNFAGPVLLSVVCPPAAFAFGAVTSLYEYAEAHEQEELYESLIDPELVLTRAEVETELFAARLGVALSFIPEAGSILRRGVAAAVRAGGARAAVRGISRAGVRGVARSITSHLTEEVIRRLERGVIEAFLAECATERLSDEIVERLLQPVLHHIERETMFVTPGDISGMQRALQMLEEERSSRPSGEAPLPGGTPSGTASGGE
jgi:hypothetical protein